MMKRVVILTAVSDTLGFGEFIYLDENFVGRNIDEEFIRMLPTGVDPCGENGEFHSFAFAGPIFKQPVKFKLGETVYRLAEIPLSTDSTSTYVCLSAARRTKGFWFCDLLPK